MPVARNISEFRYTELGYSSESQNQLPSVPARCRPMRILPVTSWSVWRMEILKLFSKIWVLKLGGGGPEGIYISWSGTLVLIQSNNMRSDHQNWSRIRKEREPKFLIPFLSSALGKRWRNSAAAYGMPPCYIQLKPESPALYIAAVGQLKDADEGFKLEQLHKATSLWNALKSRTNKVNWN
jgi:hypothetical protein